MRFELAAIVVLAGVSPGSADPVFLPEPVPSHVYDGGWEHFVGGGVAVFDCDDDNMPELFAAGGSNPSVLLRNRSERGGNLRFAANTPGTLAITGMTGAYPLDIDSDGIMDLAVLRVGENLLMRGTGDCDFEPMHVKGMEGGNRWTTAFSATWEKGRDLPTLAFGNYVDRDDPAGPFGTCDDNYLFRPEGGAYVRSALRPGYCPLSMLFSDWSRTGRPDLRVSNDRHYYVRDGQEQMWAMEAEPRLMVHGDGWHRFQLWGMGIASRDLDFDGRPEVFLTSMGDQRLQFLTGYNSPGWEDAPYELGTTAHRPYTGGDGRPSTGWHVSFGDVQNDGLDDVFIAKGNVEQMPDSAMDDPNNILVQKLDGTFREAGESAGIASFHRSRGAALVDLNLDGLLDLAVVNRRAALEVYRNATKATDHWLAVRLRQDAPNVDAIGGFLEIEAGGRTYVREIMVGGGHAGGAAGPEHFGLGGAEDIRLRVIWPDGARSDWLSPMLNRYLEVRRTADGTETTYY